MADRNSLAEFTESERAIINDVHRRELIDMTPEEVRLYGEWTAFKARNDAEILARVEACEAEAQAAIETRRKTENAALDTLEALKELALAKLKAVENGQA